MSDKHFQKYIEEQSKFLKELESKQTAFFEKIEKRLSKLKNSGHSVEKEGVEEGKVKKELKDPLSTPKYKKRSGQQRKVLEKLSNETLQKIVEDWPKFYDKYNLF
jgi:hypothetical protein